MPKICPLLTIASCAISSQNGGPEGKKECEGENCAWWVWAPGEGFACAIAANAVVLGFINQKQG